MKGEDLFGLVFVLAVLAVTIWLSYKVSAVIINSDLPYWWKLMLLTR